MPTVAFGYNGQDLEPAKPVVAALSADPDPDVAGAGRDSMLTFSYDPAGASAPIVLTEGGCGS